MSLEITEDLIDRQPAEAQAITRLLLARIEELERRLGMAPQKSSLPPSTQHPHARPASKRRRSKRKRGGQPGHPKYQRALTPTDQCDAVDTVKPEGCRRCGKPLWGTDPEPLLHQVWELPRIEPNVTDYQRHRLQCHGCGETTCAPLPLGVPESQAGPRLVGFAALLMGCFRQSKRRVAFFLEQVLQQPCSTGRVVTLQNQAMAALRPAYEDLSARLPAQEQLGIDETPTKQGPDKSWLWTCVAETFTVFRVRTSRASTVLTDLIGTAFCGVINYDRAKMYFCQLLCSGAGRI
jgi:transposase